METLRKLMSTARGAARGRKLVGGLFLLFAGAGTTLGLLASQGTAHGIPIPIPVYSIDAFSGAHHASLLNLPVGQPGVPQVPIPVDINGDILPDVTVAVNLVNVNGVFNNPPNFGAIIAPNVQIQRIPTANLLGQPSLPLKIYITLTLADSSGGPSTKVTFGYDTGTGGSIPESYSAVLGGINNFFNPLEAVIDTTGTNLGIKTGIHAFGLDNVTAPYQGPLTVLGGVSLAGQQTANFSLNYRPFPKAVDITYGTDAHGQHITHTDGVLSPVDLTATGTLTQTVTGGQSVTNLTARVDRLPRSIALDIGPAVNGGGSIDWHARGDGRPPDATVALSNTQPNQPPLNANISVESLPAAMHGEWQIAPNGLPGHALFTASGQGIGAVEAFVNNYAGTPVKLVPFVSTERQFINFQQVPGGTAGPEQLISARVERIRRLSFDQTADGFTANAQSGDGELPLQGHVGIDGRVASTPSAQIESTTTISPLPDNLTMTLHKPGADQSVNPLRLDFDSTKAVDVDASLTIRQPGTGLTDACGAANTVCGTLAVRNIPNHLEGRIIGCPLTSGNITTCSMLTPKPTTPESRIEIDDVPSSGGIQPDITADVTVGPGLFDVPGANAVPLVAHLQLQNFPQYVRVRTVEGANKTLQRLEMHTCQYDYVARSCPTDSSGHPIESEVGAVALNFRDWITRPAGLLPAASNAPTYTVVNAVGNGPNQVLFEAAGQVTHVKELQYLNNGDVFGIRGRIGSNQDLLVDANLQNINIANPLTPPNALISVHARTLVSPLPSTINICLRQNGDAISTTPFDPVTAACETANPFGDATVSQSPVAVSFDDAGTAPTFNVTASLTGSTDLGTPTNPNDDVALSASGSITNIPGNLAAFVALPGGGAGGAGVIRGLTTTSTANPAGLNINLAASAAIGGASCDDPHPAHNVFCASAAITNLSPNLSFLLDPTKAAAHADFHACNWQFLRPTPGCLTGTAGTIGNVTIGGRLWVGQPRGAPTLVPAQSPNQYLIASADAPDLSDVELRAGVSVNNITDVTYDEAPDGFDAYTNLGGANAGAQTQPLEIKGFLDTRDPTLSTGFQANADALIRNLPATLTASQHGLGIGASPVTFHVTTGPASHTIDVDGTAQIFKATAFATVASAPTCGQTDTACATIDIDRIPTDVTLTMNRVEDPVDNTTSPAAALRHSSWDVDTNAAPGAKPDLTLDGVVGIPSDTVSNLIDTRPSVAHAAILGVPPHVRVHDDESVTAPGTPSESTSPQHVWAETCAYDFVANACPGGSNSTDQIDQLTLRASDFLIRPANFPSPTDGFDAARTPIYATAVVRGHGAGQPVDAEVSLSIPAIKEVQYEDKPTGGVKGFRVAVGPSVAGGTGLATKVDVANLSLSQPSLSIGGQPYFSPVVSVKAIGQILNLPAQITVCLRQGGISYPDGHGGLLPLPAPSGDPLTTHCEADQPFTDGSGHNIGPLDHTPLSVSYDTNPATTISNIITDASAVLSGTDGGGNPLPADNYTGHLNISHVPPDITAHILTPVSDSQGHKSGPTRVEYDAPASTGPGGPSGIGVQFSASETLGDSVCKDPRPTATAMCAKGNITNLPQHVDLYYNPDQVPFANNLAAHATGGAQPMNWDGLELSTVKPDLDNNNHPTGVSSVLLAQGAIDGVGPNVNVTGSIGAPSTSPGAPSRAPSIDINANVKIGSITATVQNFIAPDPMPTSVPVRNVYKDPSSPSHLDTAEFFLRGALFKASLAIHNVNDVGYRTVADSSGAALDTQVLNVNFGTDFAVRAYADISPDPATRYIGDVLLEHVPAGLTFCFRGQNTHGGDAPATSLGTFCDGTPGTAAASPPNESQVTDHNGAFQFIGLANANLAGLDVDGFFRASTNTGANVLSGRVNITDIPYRVEGIIPASGTGASSDVDVSAYTSGGQPAGIGQIKFNAADFDLLNLTGADNGESTSGYTTPPFVPETVDQVGVPGAVFPPAVTPNQHLGAAIVGSNYQFLGQLGPGSQLQRVRILGSACVAPNPAPSDYPYFPTQPGPDGATAEPAPTYTCVGANFVQPPNANNQLDLNAYVLGPLGAQHLSLQNAGLTTIPQWFQMTLAQGGATTDPAKDNALLPVCDTAANTPGGATGCMPPMVRFDQPSASKLFGIAALGTDAELTQVDSVEPPAGETLANLDAGLNPNRDGSGWSDWAASEGSPSSGPTGIRAKLLSVGDDVVVKAGLRLPVPNSLEIDPFQSADHPDPKPAAEPYFNGRDLRFRVAVHDAGGNPVGNLGELAGIYQMGDGTKLLISNPCTSTPIPSIIDPNNPATILNAGRHTNEGSCADFAQGVKIPAEVALSLQMRDNHDTDPGKSDSQDQEFIQVDGRVSQTLDLGLRAFGLGAIGRIEAQALKVPGPAASPGNFVPVGGPAHGPDEQASFRLRAMIINAANPPSAGGPSGPGDVNDCPSGESASAKGFICIGATVQVKSVFASFNFAPCSANPAPQGCTAGVQGARRVDAVVDLASTGTKEGVEVSGYNKVDDPVSNADLAPVGVKANANIDPLNLSVNTNFQGLFDNLANDVFGGLPGWVQDIGHFVFSIVADILDTLVHGSFVLNSNLQAGLSIGASKHLVVDQNLLHVKVQNDGPGEVDIGPVDLNVDKLDANASLGFTIPMPDFIPNINIGFTILQLFFVGVPPTPLQLQFVQCNAGFFGTLGSLIPIAQTFLVGSNEMKFDPSGSPQEVVINPLIDPRIIATSDIPGFAALTKIASYIVPPFFCFSGFDGITLGAPADPVGTGLWASHPVFTSNLIADSVLKPGTPPPSLTAFVPHAPLSTPVGPTPPQPPPSYPTGPEPPTLALCGPHDYTDFTLNGGTTLRVATTASATNTTGSVNQPDCPAGDEGTLSITATHVTINGTVDAGNLITTTPTGATTAAGANSGGGHGGAGGVGSGGGAAGVSPEPLLGEPGGPDHGPGAGGGAIILTANARAADGTPGVLTVAGSIRADGHAGTADSSGACDTDYTDDGQNPDPTPPDTGGIGGGGGAGGEIILSGPIVKLNGATVSAAGGGGGGGNLGGGGGGGGGIVKITSPDEQFDPGFAPAVGGGAGGTACADQTVGQAGVVGESAQSNVPSSTLVPPATVGTPAQAVRFVGNAQMAAVTVPFQALAAAGSATNGFTEVVCGLFSSQISPAPTFTLPTPGSNTASDPCSTGIGVGHVVVDNADQTTTGTVTANLTPPVAGDGTWALWGIALRGPAHNQDCVTNSAGCVVEPTPFHQAPAANPGDPPPPPTPGDVQVTQILVRTRPVVHIDSPAAGQFVASQSVLLTFHADPDNAGPVSKFQCRVSDTANPAATAKFAACSSGANLQLLPDDGAQTIAIQATDNAGNQNSPLATVTVIVATTPPSATASISAVPSGTHGFYNSPPTITLGGYSSPAGAPPGNPEFAYHFDSQPDSFCSGPCSVDTNVIRALPSGTHAFNFTAIDVLGNRKTPETVPFTVKWDGTAPQTSFQTVPGSDATVTVGGQQWFTVQPYAVVSAVDDFGGSGLDKIFVNINGAGFVAYNPASPPLLPPGNDSVCWYATDLAANGAPSPSQCATQPIHVDNQAPAVSLSTVGGVLGLNGFYKSAPAVNAGGYSDLPSGAGAAVGAPAHGELRWRVDNSTPVSCDGTCAVDPTLLPTGTHLIGVTGFDALGNQSAEQTLTLKVDTNAPITQATISPAVPDGSNSWYTTTPYLTLTPSDQPPFGPDVTVPISGLYRLLPEGSGLASTTYTDNGGPPVTYAGSFPLADGAHNICFVSVDNAGNTETGNCHPYRVDVRNPSVTIAAPAAPASGWYAATVPVTVSAADPAPGSGVTSPAGANPGLCGDRIPPDPAPAGLCVSIDGTTFLPMANPSTVSMTEGRHSVAAFSVDASGRHGPIQAASYQVDLSPPQAIIRTVPGAAAQNGWWRTAPTVVLRATDGDQNSGAVTVQYNLNNTGWQTYTTPFTVAEGVNTVQYRSTDAAGLTSAVQTLTIPVDLTPPVVVATTPIPAVWLQLLNSLGIILGFSPSQATLNWTVSDNLSPHVHVSLVIYNVTGQAVRYLDAGQFNTTPGVTLSGSTQWDGHDQTLTGILPVGLYYYRAVAVDDAGNFAQSGQSVPIQIKAGLG